MATKTSRKSSDKHDEVAPKRSARPRPTAAKKALATDEIVKVARWLNTARLRKDLEAAVAANRKSFVGIQAVVNRQTELLKAQVGEWRSVVKFMTLAGPAQSVAQLDELTKGAFRLSLANVKELAELSMQTQAEAFELVRSRIHEDLVALSGLLDGE